MIVSTLEDVKAYLPSYNFKSYVDAARFKDFLNRAQNWVTQNILGEDIEELLEIEIEEGHTDDHAILRTLTGRVISEMAYRTAIPEFDVQNTNAGFVVQNNSEMSPASQQRIDRLVSSMTERIAMDCDALVEYLINNSSGGETYEDWRGTYQFDYLTGAFIPFVSDFNKHTRCADAYVTDFEDFLNKIAAMGVALHGKVANYISDAQVNTLLELYRDDEMLAVHRKVIEDIKLSVVAEVSGKIKEATDFAIKARQFMLVNPNIFTVFINSDRKTLSALDFGDGSVANLL